MIYLLRYWKPLAVLVLLALVWGHGHHVGAASVQAKFDKHLLADKAAEAAAQAHARQKEQALAQAQADAASAYARGKQDAEAAGKRVADALRAGNLRLSRLWRGCQDQAAGSVPGAAEGSSGTDDAASRRADSAGRIVRATHDDAEKIKALQRILQAERGRP